MKVGSLFSGIGGFDLGLERAGFQTAWFCEQEEFCQRVLRKHWPDVPIYDDITTLRGQDVEPVDALCGGFPCQDLSYAGKGAGIEGERSGLWSEYARLIGELRPRYVFVENVPALLTRGLGRVLGDLAALGYDAEWDCIPASAVGAPHRRDRVWLVAYPNGQRAQVPAAREHAAEQEPRRSGSARRLGDVADTNRADRKARRGDRMGVESASFNGSPSSAGDAGGKWDVADTESESKRTRLRADEPTKERRRRPSDSSGASGDVPDANGTGLEGHRRPVEGAAERPASSRGLAQRERERERERERGMSGQLNPTWVEWLMGFPPGWTDLGPSATRSSRKSQSGSAAASKSGKRAAK